MDNVNNSKPNADILKKYKNIFFIYLGFKFSYVLKYVTQGLKLEFCKKFDKKSGFDGHFVTSASLAVR